MSKYKIFRTHDGESIIGKIVDSNRVSFLVNRPMRISISTIGICDDMEKEMTHTAMTVTLRDWIEFSKDDDIRIPKKHVVTMVNPNKGIIDDYENAKRTIDFAPLKGQPRKEDISDEDMAEIMRKLDDSEMGKLFDYFEQTREEVIESMDETNDVFDSTNHERIIDKSRYKEDDATDWRNWSDNPEEYL